MLTSQTLSEHDKQIFELLDEAFIFLSNDLVPIWWNNSAVRMFGASRLDRRKSIFESVPEILGTEWEDYWRTAQNTRQVLVKQGFSSGRGLRAKIAPLGDSGFVHFVHDITAEMLSAKWQNALLINIPIPVLIVRQSDGVITFFNEAAQRFSGNTASVGQTIQKIWNIDRPDFSYTDQIGTPVSYEDMPISRALRGEACPSAGFEMNWTAGDITVSLVCYWQKIPASYGQDDSIVFTYHDISRVVKAERDAQRLVTTRDTFISMASHELKTPLTSVMLQTQMAKRLRNEGKLTDEKIDSLFQSWGDATKRLQVLVDDMLNTTQLGSGVLTINRKDTDLALVVKEIIEGFPNSKIQLDLLEVHGFWDPYRIGQIVTNLVTNALKYGQGKKIQISVEKDADYAVLKVQDHGIGISLGDHTRIFERFERIPSVGNISGFGLGLYIVKQIVDANQGTISVESELGVGTTFTVRLPITHKER